MMFWNFKISNHNMSTTLIDFRNSMTTYCWLPNAYLVLPMLYVGNIMLTLMGWTIGSFRELLIYADLVSKMCTLSVLNTPDIWLLKEAMGEKKFSYDKEVQ